MHQLRVREMLKNAKEKLKKMHKETAQMQGRNCKLVSRSLIEGRQIETYVHDNQHGDVKNIPLDGPAIGAV